MGEKAGTSKALLPVPALLCVVAAEGRGLGRVRREAVLQVRVAGWREGVLAGEETVKMLVCTLTCSWPSQLAVLILAC